MISVFIVLLKL